MYHENLGVTSSGFWGEAKDLRVGDVFLGSNGELSTAIRTVCLNGKSETAQFHESIIGTFVVSVHE